MTSLQQSMFHHRALLPRDHAITCRPRLIYHQPLDVAVYRQAWQGQIVCRPALRSELVLADGVALQRILKRAEFPFHLRICLKWKMQRLESRPIASRIWPARSRWSRPPAAPCLFQIGPRSPQGDLQRPSRRAGWLERPLCCWVPASRLSGADERPVAAGRAGYRLARIWPPYRQPSPQRRDLLAGAGGAANKA